MTINDIKQQRVFKKSSLLILQCLSFQMIRTYIKLIMITTERELQLPTYTIIIFQSLKLLPLNLILMSDVSMFLIIKIQPLSKKSFRFLQKNLTTFRRNNISLGEQFWKKEQSQYKAEKQNQILTQSLLLFTLFSTIQNIYIDYDYPVYCTCLQFSRQPFSQVCKLSFLKSYHILNFKQICQKILFIKKLISFSDQQQNYYKIILFFSYSKKYIYFIINQHSFFTHQYSREKQNKGRFIQASN
ncbi:unnamed protein product [Paramecium octaurelia]|uniref:Uncharacterized protein n=1 Tax=Paramecium octaurelia TaxID=43137 RepID=A0A8S1VWZ9_PAROT|nr:unnamed protein product [Paramecium octaurelia]